MKLTLKKFSIILSILVMALIIGCITKSKASANSQLNLSQKQMLLLSTYAYELNSNKLQPISDNLKTMKRNNQYDPSLVKSVESGVTPSEFIKIFQEIDSDKTLSELVAVDSIDTHIRAICFVPKSQVDKKGAEAVLVFLGTKESNEAWLDNFEGAYNEDTNMQLEAGRFFEKISQNYTITNVTGHSKGGNLTQYVTITHGEKIRNAVSFNGQGFSDLFFNKYKTNINKYASKITTISSFKDPVHVLMNKLPANEKIIKTDADINPVLSHLPNVLYEPEYFDANGNYKRAYLTKESLIVDTVESIGHLILENCSDELIQEGCEKTSPLISYFIPLGQRILEREDVNLLQATYEEFLEYKKNSFSTEKDLETNTQYTEIEQTPDFIG